MDYATILKDLETLAITNRKIATATSNEDVKRYAQSLEDAILCLRQYMEPWRCPLCGNMEKIPKDPKRPRWCAGCNGNVAFPYAYQEQERMNIQLRMLLQCAQYYSTQPNGSIASKTLQDLGKPQRKKN